MKKLYFFLFLVLMSFTISAQDTLVAYRFNQVNSNAPTAANNFNTNGQLLREPAFILPYSYPAGVTSYCLASTGWVNAMSFSGGYYTVFSSVGRSNLVINSRQKSSASGPRDFKLQYKIGVSGAWTDVIGDTIKCSSTNFIQGWLRNVVLPSECNNQPEVYLRWVVVSNISATGGMIDINGTSYIDDAVVISKFCEASAFLDKNKVKAEIHTGGVNFFKNSDLAPFFEMEGPSFEYPMDSGTHTIFCSSLWMGGKHQGKLYLAAERYHGNGRDYYPGPVMDSTMANSELVNWNRVWKIDKSEIDNHIAHWNDVGYVMPQSISQWPVYANPALNIHYYLAPFVDVDGDSAYIPAHGDYPKIRGDQAIYFIFNDSVYQHSETGGKRLGVEVHAMAYAFNTDPLLQKTVFMNYLVYNRSSRVYDSLYMGLFTDIDLGYPQDDYIGCDTTLDTYYGYNGDSIDGNGQPMAYGNNPPVQTVTMLNQSMTSFAYFNNTGGFDAITDPDIASEYYLLMQNYWKDGSHFCYGGAGHYNIGGNPSIPVRFMFPGYPNDSTQWNEVSSGNPPFDRRGVGLTGPMTLSPGQYIAFDAAYITVDSGFAKSGGFPNVDNMLATVPLIRDYFDNTFPQNGSDLALGIETENASDITYQFNVYPNPSKGKITFTTNLSHTKLRLDILDINGRLIQSYESRGVKKEMDVSNFKNGVYILKISSSEQSSYVKFIKM